MTQYKNEAQICLLRHDEIKGNDTSHSTLAPRALFFDIRNEVTEILSLTDCKMRHTRDWEWYSVVNRNKKINK